MIMAMERAHCWENRKIENQSTMVDYLATIKQVFWRFYFFYQRSCNFLDINGANNISHFLIRNDVLSCGKAELPEYLFRKPMIFSEKH